MKVHLALGETFLTMFCSNFVVWEEWTGTRSIDLITCEKCLEGLKTDRLSKMLKTNEEWLSMKTGLEPEKNNESD